MVNKINNYNHSHNDDKKNGFGPSDIVNGTRYGYTIDEKEMESALKEIYEEIGETPEQGK